MIEEWRPCSSDPRYAVSTHGRVWSFRQSGKYLKPGIASHGYPTVALGRGNSRTLHSLVSETFIGPVPEGQEIRHKDDNRQNPRLDNLVFGNRAANMADAMERGRWNGWGIYRPRTFDRRGDKI